MTEELTKKLTIAHSAYDGYLVARSEGLQRCLKRSFDAQDYFSGDVVDALVEALENMLEHCLLGLDNEQEIVNKAKAALALAKGE